MKFLTRLTHWLLEPHNFRKHLLSERLAAHLEGSIKKVPFCPSGIWNKAKQNKTKQKQWYGWKCSLFLITIKFMSYSSLKKWNCWKYSFLKCNSCISISECFFMINARNVVKDRKACRFWLSSLWLTFV